MSTLGHGVTACFTEHDSFNQGVGTQAVGTVDTDRSALAGGIEAFHRSCGSAVGLDTAHGVVDDRTYGYGSLDRINTGVGLSQLADERETFVEIFLTQMSEV